MDPREPLPISALQHLLFCERQCALIHVEGLWSENRLTAEGRVLHGRPDRGEVSARADATVERNVAVASERLGLYGLADVVEFRRSGSGLQPFPVEYKRGRRGRRTADAVQLCAQALCLEEMLSATVKAGAIFYGASRRRREVTFDRELRELTEASVGRLRCLVADGATPVPVAASHCRSCSLHAVCLPQSTQTRGAAERYLARLLRCET